MKFYPLRKSSGDYFYKVENVFLGDKMYFDINVVGKKSTNQDYVATTVILDRFVIRKGIKKLTLFQIGGGGR